MYFPTNHKAEVSNYPYGYNHRTTAYFSLEYKSGNGFRSVFQTVNPKTGLLNKPKKSTYSPVVVMKQEADGKIKNYHFHFYNDEEKIRDLAFMAENFDLFQTEEIKGIAVNVLAIYRADVYSKATYCGSDLNKLMPLYNKALVALIKIAKTGENLFSDVVVDFEAVEALEVKGYNPFKVTTHRVA